MGKRAHHTHALTAGLITISKNYVSAPPPAAATAPDITTKHTEHVPARPVRMIAMWLPVTRRIQHNAYANVKWGQG